MAYQTQSAVLFIIFNRLDTTLKVLEQIRQARPRQLYITADGPRATKPGEDVRCNETKAAVLAGIDWDCEVKTLFREQNLGPKEAISSAISWFFEHEPEGIILEHDCLPVNSFFRFCDVLLEKYRSDSRIWLISGSNLSGKKWGNASYYFSNLTHGWGWATWRRSWQQYDKDLMQYTEEGANHHLHNIFDDPMIIDCWFQLFRDTKAGKINTWDYQATFAHFFNHCINIVPNNNLVSNIGFGEGAENTLDDKSPFANVPLEEITEIEHPVFIVPEKQADMIVIKEKFQIDKRLEYLRKHNSNRRRFKRWLKQLFSS